MNETMRAISPRTWGDPDVLTLIETPRPVPGPTEILVRVHAAGVNPTDWKSRRYGGLGLWNDPVILGYDVSGVVEAVGVGVTLFRPGDEVFGMPRFPHQAGAYAEFVTGPARHFAPKPAALDHVRAAALPLAGLTALQALTEAAALRAGQRVLIHAAAGGVGHLAVQIAASLGVHVTGTASAAKHPLLRALGADELIDYRTTDFTTAVRDVDAVLDTVGGDYATRSLRVLRPGGTLVTLTSPDDVPPAGPGSAGLRTGFTIVEPDHAGLRTLTELVASRRLRVEIDTVLPLEQAAKAHELSESGRATGKIVLRVAE
ncbi:NADP-dependent oxidoreductase [Streptomyces specialis]|uniref:NADP-dependent oxidoreductase n=1 Tax=Streptomyces specialis TaxID=498367 RepID=UPI00073F76E0|nr:NADP-dependent oxidoreductase [Streptomyces specialis]